MSEVLKTKKNFILLTVIPALILASMGFLRLVLASMATEYPVESPIFDNGEYALQQLLFIGAIVVGVSMSYVMLKAVKPRVRMYIYAGLLLILAGLLSYCIRDRSSYFGTIGTTGIHFFVPYFYILAVLMLIENTLKMFSWKNYVISALFLAPVVVVSRYPVLSLTFLLTFGIFWVAVAFRDSHRRYRKAIILATVAILIAGTIITILLVPWWYLGIDDSFSVNAKDAWSTWEDLEDVIESSHLFGPAEFTTEIEMFGDNPPGPDYVYDPNPDPSLFVDVPSFASLSMSDDVSTLLPLIMRYGWIVFILGTLSAVTMIVALSKEAVNGPNKKYTCFIYVTAAYFIVRSVFAIIGCFFSTSFPVAFPFCGSALTTLSDTILFTYSEFAVLHGEAVKRKDFTVKKDKPDRQNDSSINTFNANV